MTSLLKQIKDPYFWRLMGDTFQSGILAFACFLAFVVLPIVMIGAVWFMLLDPVGRVIVGIFALVFGIVYVVSTYRYKKEKKND